MRKLVTAALFVSLFPACVVYSNGPGPGPDAGPGPGPAYVDSPPSVYDGQAGCYWDDSTGQDKWYFQASVDDPDGTWDVTDVWADVYDNWDGSLIDSFQLYPTNDAYTWYSEWPAASTALDCWYGDYAVDLVAYDSANATSDLTVWPSTY